MTRDHPWLDGPLPAGRGEWVREIEALMREVGLEGEIPPPSAWTPRVLMPPCSECGRTACTLIDSRLEVYAARIRELVAERDEARADMVNADHRAVNSDLHRKRADEALARVRELEEALREKPAVSSEALDFAEMTLDGTLPYEETWRTNAEAVVALAARIRELEAENKRPEDAV